MATKVTGGGTMALATLAKSKDYPRTYGYDLYYHAPESTPRDWPTESSRPFASAAERDAELTRYIASTLSPQGYIVTRVILNSFCGHCDGTGQITIKPKGRKNPAWFLCRKEECPTCHGQYRVVENDTVAR